MKVTYKSKSEAPKQMSYVTGEWQFGTYMAVFDGEGLAWLGFHNDAMTRFRKAFPDVTLGKESRVFDLDAVLKSGDVDIVCYGTSFQHDVWKRLVAMKAGETLHYSDIANDLGRPKAMRAVGSAVGANPVSIFIPCHRVLPKSGGVGNYASGPTLKEKLLRAEKIFA